ncbi:MAG: hypothetical protein ACI4HZ_01885, partial [Ruminococcus sp.]
AGHIWVVAKNKHTLYEKLTVLPYDSKIDIEEEDNTLIVDDIGCEFVLESEYGISNINIYKVDYDINSDGTLKLTSRKQKSSFSNLKQEKLFIRCDLGEFIPTTQFEIKRSDYAIITFDIYESGKNGHIIACNYKYKMTFKSFLYHLCV